MIGAIIGYPHVRLLAGRWRVYEPHFAAVVVVLLGGFIICVEHPSDAPRVLRLIAASLLILLLLTLRPALLSYMRNRGEPTQTPVSHTYAHYIAKNIPPSALGRARRCTVIVLTCPVLCATWQTTVRCS